MAASQGTWMATHYAMARPERVERLAMICPGGIVSSPVHQMACSWCYLTAYFRPTRAKTEAFVDSMAMEQTRPCLRTDPWRPIVQQLDCGDGKLPGETCPRAPSLGAITLSGWPRAASLSSRSSAVTRHLHNGATMAERFRRQVPHARIVFVDDANHLLFVDQPDVVAEQLQKFLAAA